MFRKESVAYTKLRISHCTGLLAKAAAVIPVSGLDKTFFCRTAFTSVQAVLSFMIF